MLWFFRTGRRGRTHSGAVVTRSHIAVRAADESDLADLVLLWAELKRCGAFGSAGRADRRRTDRRAGAPAAQPAERPDLARLDRRSAGRHGDGDHGAARGAQRGAVRSGRIHGRRRAVPSPRRRPRTHGCRGRGYAEEIGAEQITVSVSPMSREANRFYAQLGLTPLAVRRVAPAAALRRRDRHDRPRPRPGRLCRVGGPSAPAPGCAPRCAGSPSRRR